MEHVTDNVVSVLSYNIGVVKKVFLNLYWFSNITSDSMEVYVKNILHYPNTVQ